MLTYATAESLSMHCTALHSPSCCHVIFLAGTLSNTAREGAIYDRQHPVDTKPPLTMKDAVELSKQLVRTVVRMFYEIEHIVVMDALCYHGALSISDLVLVLDAGKNSKHVGKLVGKLKEAGMCAV